jgi:hypothetical protein
MGIDNCITSDYDVSEESLLTSKGLASVRFPGLVSMDCWIGLKIHTEPADSEVSQHQAKSLYEEQVLHG